MKYLSIFLAVVLVSTLFSCKNQAEEKSSETQKEPTIVQKIAQANGLDNFEKIEELSFTFNVKVNDSLRTSREWTWDPKTNMVSLTTKDSTVAYDHKSEAGQHVWVDQRFINDQYWLLFPFHLVWDEMEWEHEKEAKAPISGKTFEKITVTYPSNKGYTPGDVYEIFFDESLMIREWTYRPGGSTEKAFPATWANYKDFGGIKIATRHSNKDGSFELFFTDVEIRD